MNFWPTHFRSRFSLCSLWSVIFLCLLCVYCTLLAPHPPPPTTKFCVDYCFQILLGGLYIPKRIWKQFLMQNCAVNRVHYGGFEISQREEGACAPVAPLPHYSPLRSHAAMGFFLAAYRRELWSRKYLLRTCLHQKDRTLIKRVHLLRFLYPSLLQNLLSLFDRQSNQALVEAFQNVDYVVLKWKH